MLGLYASLAVYVFSVWLYLRFVPLYLKSLGADPQVVGFVYSANSVALAAAYIVGGYAADRFDRARLLVFSMAVSAVLAPIIYALSEQWLTALVALLVYSFAGALMRPAVSALIASAAPRERRATAFGALDAVLTVPSVVGPLVGGFLISSYGYRHLFAVSALFGAASLILARLWARRLPSEHVRGAGEERSIRATISAVFEGFRAACMSRRLLLAIASLSLYSFAYGLASPFIAIYFNTSLGVPESLLGLLFSAGGLVFVLLQIPAGYFADRVGRGAAAAIGLAAASAAYVGYANAGSLPEVFALFAVEAAGTAIANPALTAVVADYTPSREYLGRVYGLVNAVSRLISIPAPAIGGALWSRDSPYLLLYIAALILATSSICTAPLIKPKKCPYIHQK